MPPECPGDVSPSTGAEPGSSHASDSFLHVLQSHPDDVRQALRSAVARFARVISADDAGALELTLAEVLNNVVEHAYAGTSDGPIVLEVMRGPGALCCRIMDRGHPLPDGLIAGPAAAIAPRPENQLPVPSYDDFAEGGYGWPLIRSLTSDLSYLRHGQMNVLTFRLLLGRS